MKLLAISDIHAGESRESATHLGIIRQTNSQALEEFSQLIPRFNEIKPDLIFQMGDLIRETSNQEHNKQLMEGVLKVFSQLHAPVVHLLGNHEVKGLTGAELQTLLPNQSYGAQELGNFQLIWLGVEAKDGKFAFPQDQLQWLETVINPDKKVLVFSHFSIAEQDDRGNFYFDGTPEKFLCINSPEVFEILKDKKVQASFSANAHWAGYKFDNFHHVCLPSFTEHLMKSEKEDASPAVFVLIEDINNTLVIKGYSGEFCFLNIVLLLN